MDRLRSENETTLKEEVERMRMEIEQEKADLQVSFALLRRLQQSQVETSRRCYIGNAAMRCGTISADKTPCHVPACVHCIKPNTDLVVSGTLQFVVILEVTLTFCLCSQQDRFAEGVEVNTDKMMKLEIELVEVKAQHAVLGMQVLIMLFELSSLFFPRFHNTGHV